MAKIPVSFRLEPPIERLLKEAVSRSGKRQSEYLEAMTIAHLTGDKLDAMSDELTATKREVSRLRGDLLRMMEAVFIASGFKPEDAQSMAVELRERPTAQQ